MRIEQDMRLQTILLAGAILFVAAVIANESSTAPLPESHETRAAPIQSADPKLTAAIENLGSQDYRERESAQQTLELIGEPALKLLIVALTSESPEVSNRARLAINRIEHKLLSDKYLAPTIVELNAKQIALSTVLEDLSRQSKYQVKLVETQTGQAGTTIVTGRVPFFAALLQLCSIADLELCSVGAVQVSEGRSFDAPARAKTSVFLKSRGSNPRRPAMVHGATLVEVLTVPKDRVADDGISTRFHVWAEPKLDWRGAKEVSIRSATDDSGQFLLRERPTHSQSSRAGVAENQSVEIRLQPGRTPSVTLTEVTGTVHGLVRTDFEVLVGFGDMKPGVVYEGRHRFGASLKATLAVMQAGQWRVDVDLEYGGSIIADGKGVQVRDATGNRYPVTYRRPPLNRPGSTTIRRELSVHSVNFPNRGNTTSLEFRGSYCFSVAIPFVMKDVPLNAR